MWELPATRRVIVHCVRRRGRSIYSATAKDYGNGRRVLTVRLVMPGRAVIDEDETFVLCFFTHSGSYVITSDELPARLSSDAGEVWDWLPRNWIVV
jgi:hypothetical protein